MIEKYSISITLMFVSVILYYLRPYIKENFDNIESINKNSPKDK